ncbi:MAG TPA: FAD binding domain-containing protein [Candidatus Dormibacteraeota bacterium]|nr:FAD binding domain-containing protein [Candidatus Dormibacteraeota bacterium]
MATEFLAPTSVEEALEALGTDGALALAGGTQVGILIRQGLLEAGRLVWLGRVEGLRGIASAHGGLEIGAGVTLAEIAESPLVRDRQPALAAAAARVGNPRVRSVATLGGHLAHADPRQDLPPVLLALDAVAVVRGPAGERQLPLTELFLGPFETSLSGDELLTRVRIPAAPPTRRSGYVRFAPGSETDYATVGVAACLELEDQAVRRLVLGLGGVAGRPLRVEPAGLAGRPVGPELLAVAAEAAVRASDPISDQRGSAGYKRAMVGLWTRRALAGLAGDEADGTAPS